MVDPCARCPHGIGDHQDRALLGACVPIRIYGGYLDPDNRLREYRQISCICRGFSLGVVTQP